MCVCAIAEHWNFQSADPGERQQRGKPVKETGALGGEQLPYFGPARAERAKAWARECSQSAGGVSVALAERYLDRRLCRPAPRSSPPTVADIIGRALDKVGTYNELSNKEHVSRLYSPITIPSPCRVHRHFASNDAVAGS